MQVEIKDIDFFPGKIIKFGNSLAVTIPSNNVEFSGLKEGMKIKVYYKVVK